MAADTKVTDPRNVAETYVNIPHSVYLNGGMIHFTLAIERPVIDARPGTNFRTEREVVLRVVMPADAALTLSEAIKGSLSPLGKTPLNQPLQS